MAVAMGRKSEIGMMELEVDLDMGFSSMRIISAC